VYHLLKQRTFLKEKERGISQAGISKAMGMSKEAAGNALQTLKNHYLVEESPATAVNKPPRYEVVHAKDVLASHPEFRTQGDCPQDPQERAEFQLRVKRVRVPNSSHVEDGIPADGVLDSDRSRAEFQPPNKEEVLKEKVQEQDTTSLPSFQEGGYKPIEEQDCETQNETAVADGVVRSGAEVLAAAARHSVATEHSEVPTPTPAARSGHGAPAPAGPRVASDGLTPARDTLQDLLRDLQAPRVETPAAPVPPSREHTPRELATFFLQYLHDLFPIGNGNAMAKTRGENWEDPYEAWMRCFDHVCVSGVEMDGTRLVVILETPRPRDLVSGLVKYRAKVQLSMKKAFGREVQLVPRLEAA
jgi:hypothetical protein